MTQPKTRPKTRQGGMTRRRFLATTAAMALATAIGLTPERLMAADPIKTAGIYTVPVEQQWVSRIHKAATAAQERGDVEYTFSENVSNTDYARVMREYAESGYTLIIGEVFAVEDEAREVAAEYPNVMTLINRYPLASKTGYRTLFQRLRHTFNSPELCCSVPTSTRS